MIAVTGFIVLLGVWAATSAQAGLLGCVRFVALNLAVCWSAHLFVTAAFGACEPSRRGLLWCLFAFAQIVLTSAVLGFAGALTCDGMIALNLGVMAAACVLSRRGAGPPTETVADSPEPYDCFALGVAGAAMLACAAYLRLGLSLPLNHVDDLMHHLRFPVEWIKAKRIFICFAPCGMDAPSYAPCNAELLYTYLLLPLQADVLAKIGQFPFFLMGGVATYRLAVQAGARRSGALCGASLFLLNPAALRQSISCNVDVAFASLLVASISCLVDHYRERTMRSFCVFALAVGLMLGSKLFAGLFVVCLLAAAAPVLLGDSARAKGWHLAGMKTLAVRVAIGAVLLTAFGGFWYLRNWVVTGSALYPMGVTVFGFTIMPGAYSRSAMAETSMVPQDPMWDLLGAAFGDGLLILWGMLASLLILGWIWERSRGRSGVAPELDMAGWAVVLSPIPYCALLWVALPYRSPNHFLAGSALAGVLPAIMVAGRHRLRVLSCVVVAVMCVLHLVPVAELAGLWPILSRRSLLLPSALLYAGICWGLAMACALAVRRIRAAQWRWTHLAAPALVAWLYVCHATGHDADAPLRRWVRFRIPNYGALVDAWLWSSAHLRGEVVALAGNTIAYPLYGWRYVNDVVHVNVDEHFGWKFHDYDLHERTRPGYQPPKTEKIAYHRLRPRYEAWLANLRRRRATILFVATVPPLDVWTTAVDSEGFPVERAWADANPDVFEPVFGNRRAKIYRIRLAPKAPER